MKTPARLALLLFAGLILAGCATKTAQTQPQPVSVAWGDKPLSARDHFYLRDLEDKIERTFEPSGR